MSQSSLIDAQLAREAAHTAETRAVAMQGLLDAIENGDVNRVPAARALITRAFSSIHDVLKHTLDTINTRTVGLEWLRLVGPVVPTVLLLRRMCGVALSDKEPTLQRICVDLGRHIIEEGTVKQALQVNNMYMQKAVKHLENRKVKSEKHARLTMQAAVRTVMHESMEIDATVALQTGKWVLDSALATGIVVAMRATKSKHSAMIYRLHPELEAALFSTRYADSAVTTGMLMIAPPNPWEPGMIGGYLAPTKNPLARRFKNKDSALLRKGLEQSSQYLDALNTLQEIPFEFDQRAVQIVRRVWLHEGRGLLGIPSINPSDSPPFPFPSTWVKENATEEELEQFKVWKHAKADWHTAELERKGEASTVGVMLREAVDLADKTVYAPVFGDWRGRIYYQGCPNPQGPDYARAALRFHDKKPLGSRGLYWLKVHIANSFGQDSMRFDQRAKWVDANMAELIQGMTHPENSDAYAIADYPVLAAVAVQELVQALDSPRPEEFLSGLPVHMDATCSGLQHYSALLRDPVGGRYVNLIDEGLPNKADIYSKVLETTQQLLIKDLQSSRSVMAELWLETNMTRDLAKKPVMTYVYNAKARSVSTHARKWLQEQGFNKGGVSVFTMGDYLCKLLFAAIASTVPAAAECMEWLCKAARLHGRDTPLRWATPVGTTVHQIYRNTKSVRVEIRSCNIRSAIVLEDLDTMRMSKMVSAVAPNFIHSLDSTHVVRVANAAKTLGMQIVGIHDSIGTHPSDVDLLHKIIRNEFVNMYQEHNPLRTLVELNSLNLDIPNQGKLDLNSVNNSEFFFC